MKRPTLSIVVPNYNHGHYLPACLDSILSQSWQPDELMVIDDCSTDNSVEIIEGYQKRYPQIRLHRNERNRGCLWNLNWGMEQATGDFIYFPGADDVLLPGLFEKSMKILAEHPEAGACCGIGDWRESATGWRWFVGVGLADRTPMDAAARSPSPRGADGGGLRVRDRPQPAEIGRAHV